MTQHRIDPPSADAERPVLSIGELTARIKDCLRQEFAAVWVVGEISDLARPQSGHVYLTLKDEESQIRAVIWRATAQRIDFPLDDGVEVLCQGEVDVYPPRGSYQLIIRRIEQRGEGTLQKQLRELQTRLAAEGLFDPQHKLPLPAFPRRVAVITSATGAAVRDFLNVASRRWRGSEILIVPSLVQGAAAASDIVAAIHTATNLAPRPDVIVVTRGGGSMEDLWCFNDERVVRAIFAARIPIVSAVGHEIDVTLADLVADLRATTPSEAAERVFPAAVELQKRLQSTGQRMAALLQQRVQAARRNLTAVADRPALRRPFDMTQDRARHLDELELRARRAAAQTLATRRATHAATAARLEALSPLGVLARGYSLTTNAAGEPIRDAADVSVGDELTTLVARGKIYSTVNATQRDETD